MSYHILVGYLVRDEVSFQRYYTSLVSLLASHEGECCYDIDAREMLLAKRPGEISRVIAIRFTCKSNMERFFSDRAYQLMRGRHVLKSFAGGETIFGYDLDATRCGPEAH